MTATADNYKVADLGLAEKGRMKIDWWDFFNFLNAPCAGDRFHQFFAIETFFFSDFFKVGIYFDKFIIIHNISDETDGKKRLNAT